MEFHGPAWEKWRFGKVDRLNSLEPISEILSYASVKTVSTSGCNRIFDASNSQKSLRKLLSILRLP